jgi:phage terminase large subunit-like protein
MPEEEKPSLIVTPELVHAARDYWLAAWDAAKTVTEELKSYAPDVSADGAKMLAFASLFLAHAKKLGAPIPHVLNAASELLGSDAPGSITSIH